MTLWLRLEFGSFSFQEEEKNGVPGDKPRTCTLTCACDLCFVPAHYGSTANYYSGKRMEIH